MAHALVTRKATAATIDLAAEQRDVERAGLKTEQRLSHGALVSGAARQFAALEKKGYRVRELPDLHLLKIGGYSIDIARPQPRGPAALAIPAKLKRAWKHFLVQLAGPRSEAWTRAIEAEGVEVVEPMSRYGLFVTGDAARIDAVRKLPFVTWAGEFLPAYRLGAKVEGLKGSIKHLSIGVYPATAAPAVRDAIKSSGGAIVEETTQRATLAGDYRVLIAELDAKQIAKIATLPDVRWVEHRTPDALNDERSTQIMIEDLDGAAAPNTAPLTGYQANLAAMGLTGAGVTIGIVDSGVDNHDNATMHADLAGRMAFFVDTTAGAATTDTNGHGTHVAGIAVGNAATGDTDPQGFLLGQGMAPGAQFGSINAIGTGGTANDDFRVENCVSNGAQVMNNSWGATGSAGSGYTARCATYDQRVRNPDDDAAGLEYLVMVSAAGNDGPGASTVGNPWEAKNPIVVGNSLNFRPGELGADDIRGLASSSSRGPAIDGRFLPTIVAPGSAIISARPTVDANPGTAGVQRPRTAFTDAAGTVHQDHYNNSGTSMASPHVAGMCALLIQWWRNRTNGRNPSPALLKALLVNGAEDCAGGPDGNGGNLANIPNSNQGWGRVSLENIVLQTPDSDRGPRIFSDQRHAFTANGQEFTIRVAPVDVTRPMRITLVWTDAAGAAGANPALVNDLDLEVTETATAQVFRGNVFANGFSTAGGAADTLNNVECVYLQNPAGTYEVTVVATNVGASARPDIATPWQDFALALENAEVPAAAPVSVVPLIDRSGSMVTAGYVEVTKTSSKQFIDVLSLDDSLGVVSFGSSSTVEYPTGASPTLQTIDGQPVRDAAKTEVDGINFGGCTYMGAGINQAAGLLSAVAGNRAIVMLSDGYDNKGCDPGNASKPSAMDAVAALPANLPVYTCAMGPASDQVLLEQIATASNGRYYYMPAIDDLFEIYNYIRGQVTGDSIIVNDSGMASQSSMSGFVDATASEATFTVSWADTTLGYVPREPVSSSEIHVRLRDPKGRAIHPHDSYVRKIVGMGYVAFKMQEPMPGNWQVEVMTARTEHTRYTVGGFVRSPVRLSLPSWPRPVGLGKPLDILARIQGVRSPVTGLRGQIQVRRLATGVPDLLKRHQATLQKIKPVTPKGGDAMPLDIARLQTLRAQSLAKGQVDLFAHSIGHQTLKLAVAHQLKAPDIAARLGLSAAPADHGSLVALPSLNGAGARQAAAATLTGRFTDTRQAGSYNIVVTVDGALPASNTRFVRKELVSVLVR